MLLAKQAWAVEWKRTYNEPLAEFRPIWGPTSKYAQALTDAWATYNQEQLPKKGKFHLLPYLLIAPL